MSDYFRSLPNEILLHIFDRIPLLDLLHLDQVCPRWSGLLARAAARRRSLVLILGGYQIHQMRPFQIPFNDDARLSMNGYRPPYYALPVSERDASLTLPYLIGFPPMSFDQFLEKKDLSDETVGFFDILYSGSLGGHIFCEMLQLYHSCLTGHLVSHLAQLFPKVNSLVVIYPYCEEEELSAVVDLIGHWSLVRLKLWIKTSDIDKRYVARAEQHPIGILLRAIGQQSSLQELTLDIDGDGVGVGDQVGGGGVGDQVGGGGVGDQVGEEGEGDQVGNDGEGDKVEEEGEDDQVGGEDVDDEVGEEGDEDDDNLDVYSFPAESYSFISRLKIAKLYLGHYDSINSIWQTVHQFDSGHLRYIGLGNQADLLVNAALDPEFDYPARVRHLYKDRCFVPVEQLNQLCVRFTSLTMVSIFWLPNMTFTYLVANLATLPHLTTLGLFVLIKDMPVDAFALVEDGGNDEEPRPNSLPQVRILKLRIIKRSHQDFESLSSLVFPSVEMVVLLNLNEELCTNCRPNWLSTITEVISKGESKPLAVKRCNRLFIRTLRDKFVANRPFQMCSNGGPAVNSDADGHKLESQLKYYNRSSIFIVVCACLLIFWINYSVIYFAVMYF